MANTTNNDTDRYNVLSARTYQVDGEERTEWTRIGVAFPNRLEGFNVKLHCIPAAIDGEVSLVIAKHVPKDTDRT